ncbi:hypothetical protein PR048_012816 [Dryococelus australis]|uniref:Uncharacterized protein n=1 Tax=Dryococelus australis TaxID=614101 RepID=A0ABQ9HQF3_9NEOP|nr:hypothetical protein PR048_012816 [Dryococelus australis]
MYQLCAVSAFNICSHQHKSQSLQCGVWKTIVNSLQPHQEHSRYHRGICLLEQPIAKEGPGPYQILEVKSIVTLKLQLTLRTIVVQTKRVKPYVNSGLPLANIIDETDWPLGRPRTK